MRGTDLHGVIVNINSDSQQGDLRGKAQQRLVNVLGPAQKGNLLRLKRGKQGGIEQS